MASKPTAMFVRTNCGDPLPRSNEPILDSTFQTKKSFLHGSDPNIDVLDMPPQFAPNVWRSLWTHRPQLSFSFIPKPGGGESSPTVAIYRLERQPEPQGESS